MKKTRLHSEVLSRTGKPDVHLDIHSVVEDGESKQVLAITTKMEGRSHEHWITVGSDDEPLPENYDLSQLEKDVAVAKKHAVAMVDGHHRSAGLVDSLISKLAKKV